MTTTKRHHRAEIRVTTRHGHIRPRVRHGWFDVDGGLAVLLIVIILAARMIAAVVRFSWPIATALLARFARSSRHYTVLLYRALRAFYIP